MDSTQLKLNDLRTQETAVYFNNSTTGIDFVPDGKGIVDRVEMNFSSATLNLIWGWEQNKKVKLWVKNEWLLDYRKVTLYGYNDYGLSDEVGNDVYTNYCENAASPCDPMSS